MNLAFDSDRGGRDQWVAWLASIMAECRRVLKPGGYALVWALPRTSHWTGMALEEAGFALRDQISHLFGSGFPKSQCCLKPAHEVWWLAKAPGPLQPLQIDACRVATGGERPSGSGDCRGRQTYAQDDWTRMQMVNGGNVTPEAGRWPPNVLLSHHPNCRPTGVRHVRGNGHYPAARGAGGLGTAGHRGQQDLAERHMDGEHLQAWCCVDGCPIKALDEQAGPRASGAKTHSHAKASPGWRFRGEARGNWPASTGSASRFFPTFAPEPEDAVPFCYVPKASRRDRGEGNTHCTVKPSALMAWLCRLVCWPGGTVLDPFCGSGSTLVACMREGMGFIGIDAEPSYVDIARRRIAHEHEKQTGPLFAGVAP